MDSVDLFFKYGGALPRYTSYPTAAEFVSEVDNKKQAIWLSTLEEKSLSLYIHIPFCRSLCWFCGCHTKITKQKGKIETYLHALYREIATVASFLNQQQCVSHLAFGGGSPNILTKDQFSDLMSYLRRWFNFEKGSEISIELDPRLVDHSKVACYSREGVSRISVGLQDFDPRVQKAINRVQSFEETKGVIDNARKEGIDQVNVDLIYGLPLQTLSSMKCTLEKVFLLDPNRVSVFSYAHVPWMKPHMRMIKESEILDARERIAMFKFMEGELLDRGYMAVGLDHFVKEKDSMYQKNLEGSLQRNFQGYTTDENEVMLGFGASAISKYHQGYLQNISDISAYQDEAEANNLLAFRGIELTRDNKISREAIESIMTNLSLDLFALEEKYSLDNAYFEEERRTLSEMEKDGLLTFRENRVQVDAEKRLFLRSVANVFDQYTRKVPKKHSLSV